MITGANDNSNASNDSEKRGPSAKPGVGGTPRRLVVSEEEIDGSKSVHIIDVNSDANAQDQRSGAVNEDA